MCCSSMLGVALDDFTVTVVDIDTRRTVRVFTGHLNTVTDMVRYLAHSASYRQLVTLCVMSLFDGVSLSLQQSIIIYSLGFMVKSWIKM